MADKQTVSKTSAKVPTIPETLLKKRKRRATPKYPESPKDPKSEPLLNILRVALVEPHYTYALPAILPLNQEHLKRVKKQFNVVKRIFNRYGYVIEDIELVMLRRILVFIHKCENGYLPISIPRNNVTHQYLTRGTTNGNISTVQCNNNALYNSFVVKGLKHYNHLPISVRKIKLVSTFRKQLTATVVQHVKDATTQRPFTYHSQVIAVTNSVVLEISETHLMNNLTDEQSTMEESNEVEVAEEVITANSIEKMSDSINKIATGFDSFTEKLDAMKGSISSLTSSMERVCVGFDSFNEKFNEMNRSISAMTSSVEKVCGCLTMVTDKIDREVGLMSDKLDRGVGIMVDKLDRGIGEMAEKLDRGVGDLNEKMSTFLEKSGDRDKELISELKEITKTMKESTRSSNEMNTKMTELMGALNINPGPSQRGPLVTAEANWRRSMDSNVETGKLLRTMALHSSASTVTSIGQPVFMSTPRQSDDPIRSVVGNEVNDGMTPSTAQSETENRVSLVGAGRQFVIYRDPSCMSEAEEQVATQPKIEPKEVDHRVVGVVTRSRARKQVDN